MPLFLNPNIISLSLINIDGGGDKSSPFILMKSNAFLPQACRIEPEQGLGRTVKASDWSIALAAQS